MTPSYDMVVIGAGIHGAGVAQAAAAGGYSVCLLEQYEAAALGTSGRSSKLIHGGLRYLESAEFGLVHECLRERRLLLKNAPDLVTLKPFYIPVYRDSRRSSLLIRAGLMLYALLGGGRFRRVPHMAWQTLDGLRSEGLCQVFQYYDAQTDDAALTRAVLVSAERLGAHIHYQAPLLSAQREAQGYFIRYGNTDAPKQCQARVLVNAGGPWVNHILRCIKPAPPVLPMTCVRGSHLVLPGALQAGIYYLQAPADGRALFAMPYYHAGRAVILLGTTEVVDNADPGTVAPSVAEIRYLLETYNFYFSKAAGRMFNEADVLDQFAGLRVLPQALNGLTRRSRETRFAYDDPHDPRLLSIYGGKLTSYRATAEKVLAQLRPQLPRRRPTADTRTLSLT